MAPNNTDKLYLYYQQKDVLPTYARFATIEDLNKHNLFRHNFFLDKLHLPPKIFQGANLIEFGPDCGENSLVFASWGADVTLVEPNPNAWSHILDYFKKFGLSEKLKLVRVDIESFEPKEKFQFIDAEGFVYTVRPESIWVNLFNRILEEDGFFIISYYESLGSLLELIHKLIYARAKDITGLDSKDMAWKLFQTKWNSIPHTRSFNSWVIDVLNNPFVKLKYFFNARSLCEQLAKNGFLLYSSWPNYLDFSSVYWHKRELPFDLRVAKSLDFITRSSLSFVFGKKLFIYSEADDEVKSINDMLLELIVLIDRSIDEFNKNAIKKCDGYLDKIKRFLSEKSIAADSQEDKVEVLQLIKSIRKLFELLIIGNIDKLINFCNSDRVFIRSWGIPAHFAVFRKTKATEYKERS